MPGHGVVHRRDAKGAGHPIAFDLGQSVADVPFALNHHEAAGQKRGEGEGVEAPDVPEGRDRKGDVVRPRAEHLGESRPRGEDVAVGELDALGLACRAGRVEQKREGVGPDRDGVGDHALACAVELREPLPDEVERIVLRGLDRGVDVVDDPEDLGRKVELFVELPGETRPAQHGGAPGVVDDRLALDRGQAEIEGEQHGADSAGRQQGDHVDRGVSPDDGDPVALPDAVGGEPGRQRVRRLEDLRPGVAEGVDHDARLRRLGAGEGVELQDRRDKLAWARLSPCAVHL